MILNNPFISPEDIDKTNSHEDEMSQKEQARADEIKQKHQRPAGWKPYKRPSEISQEEIDAEVKAKARRAFYR